MSFAKQPSQPPQFDAGAFAKHAGITAADVKNFQAWKQWVGGELAFDGTGLRDVVAANATALNAVKADLDKHTNALAVLSAQVALLEAKPSAPFPGAVLE